MYRLPAAAPASSSAALTSPSTTLFPSATPLSPLLRSFFSYSEGRRGVADGKGRSRRGSALLWSTAAPLAPALVTKSRVRAPVVDGSIGGVGLRGRAGSIGGLHRILVLAPWEDRSGGHPGCARRFPHDSAVVAPTRWGADANDPPRAPLPAPSGLRGSRLPRGPRQPSWSSPDTCAFSAWAARSCEPPGGSPAGIAAMPRATPGTPGTTRTAPAVSARSQAAPGTPGTTRRIRPARRVRCALSAGFACRFRRFRGPGPPLTGARWRRCPRARIPGARTGPGPPC